MFSYYTKAAVQNKIGFITSNELNSISCSLKSMRAEFKHHIIAVFMYNIDYVKVGELSHLQAQNAYLNWEAVSFVYRHDKNQDHCWVHTISLAY